MAARDPEIRRRIASMGGNAWKANCQDRAAHTLPARQALLITKFENEVDPKGRLDPVERALRAESARKAYFTGLALKSAKARAARKAAREDARTALRVARRLGITDGVEALEAHAAGLGVVEDGAA